MDYIVGYILLNFVCWFMAVLFWFNVNERFDDLEKIISKNLKIKKGTK